MGEGQPLTLLICPDRTYGITLAEKEADVPAHTGQDGTLRAGDMDGSILPELRSAGAARMVIANIDLAAENIQIRLLRTVEDLPEGSVVILTAADENRIIPPLRSRAGRTARAEGPGTPEPWRLLGPCAAAAHAASSKGSEKGPEKQTASWHILATAPMRPEAAGGFTEAVRTLAQTAAGRRVGGSRGIIEGVVHRAEHEATTLLRQAAAGNVPDGRAADELAAAYRTSAAIASASAAIRRGAEYNQPVRTAVTMLLTAAQED